MICPWKGYAHRQPEQVFVGVVSEVIAENTGQEVDDKHAFCTWKFLGTNMVEISGEVQEVLRDTTDIPKDGFFEKCIDPIRAYSASFGIDVPDPDDAQLQPAIEWHATVSICYI
jgi:hypothetical protein